METTATIDAIYTQFDLNPVHGFLPEHPPLQSLPAYYHAWDELATSMTPLLQAQQFQAIAAQLPVLEIEQLKTRPEQERAFLLLSMFGHAFQWQNGDPAQYIPAGIAQPWAALAKKLDRPTILMHGSLVLQNWRLVTENAPFSLDNLTTNHQFLGGLDEAWFYLVTVAIEHAGVAAIQGIVEARLAVEQDDQEGFEAALEKLVTGQQRMHLELMRMWEKCDPYIFFTRVRPYLASFENVEFKGVEENPMRSHHGGSAAQSTLIQAIDAALDIEHQEQRAHVYLQLMRQYMPVPHRQFLEWIEAGPSLRDYAQQSEKGKALMKEAVNHLYHFRQAHLEMVAKYIMKQGSNAGPGADKGTGGTNPMVFCKQVRNDTV